MAYATVEQAVEKMTEADARALAGDVNSATGYDAALIQRVLDDGAAEMDSYFATKYATPLDPIPALVTSYNIDLAVEILDRGQRQSVKDAAARVRAWLKDVAKGVATLGVTPGSDAEPATSGDAGAVVDAPDRVFDDAGLAAYLGRC